MTEQKARINNMGYTNSSLVSYTKLSPNHSGQRTHSIDRITPHCVVGQLSCESICGCFTSPSRQASCNYGSSMAEGESASISENNKWSIKKRFLDGTYKLGYVPYGYRWKDGEILVDPAQAEIVKRIFRELLSGKGTETIAKELNQEQVLPKRRSLDLYQHSRHHQELKIHR